MNQPGKPNSTQQRVTRRSRRPALRLTRRGVRRCLWAAGVVFLVGGITASGWMVASDVAAGRLPDTDPSNTRARNDGSVGTAADAGAAGSIELTMADFEPLWRLEIRRPLFDPPPPTPEVKPPFRPPPFPGKLIGTMVDGQRSVAIFTDARQATAFVEVGETFENATVKTIEHQKVVLDYYDQPLTLELKPQED